MRVPLAIGELAPARGGGAPAFGHGTVYSRKGEGAGGGRHGHRLGERVGAAVGVVTHLTMTFSLVGSTEGVSAWMKSWKAARSTVMRSVPS